MLSLVDINSFTAFSRVCGQLGVARDMEAEVMRYFIGLNKDEWYVLLFYDSDGGKPIYSITKILFYFLFFHFIYCYTLLNMF